MGKRRVFFYDKSNAECEGKVQNKLDRQNFDEVSLEEQAHNTVRAHIMRRFTRSNALYVVLKTKFRRTNASCTVHSSSTMSLETLG